MTSLEADNYAHPVCFSRRSKKSKTPSNSLTDSPSSRTQFTPSMRNSLNPEVVSQFAISPECTTNYRKSWQRHAEKHYYESDPDSDYRPRRSIFLCFSFRSLKFSTKRKQQKSMGTVTETPKRRLKQRDDSATDIPDSNKTTRSEAVDCDNPNSSRENSVSRTSSFFSAVSLLQIEIEDDADDFYSVSGDDYVFESVEEPSGLSTRAASDSIIPLCACGFQFHSSVYNPEFPLITPPTVIPDSHEECLAIANACIGRWETILSRSESLDAQYRCLGLGMVKRSVMNRLAVPLTMFIEDNSSILHCWIHTPLGVRHMKSNLYHEESADDDPDAGRWVGVTHVVDFSISWYCDGRPVRAIQQQRRNPSIGTSVETRCVLPDPTEGKVMLFQFVMIPKGSKEKLKADRILKYIGPKKE